MFFSKILNNMDPSMVASNSKNYYIVVGTKIISEKKC